MNAKIVKSWVINNTYRNMFWFGLLVFLISNQYFGWNETAQSGAERVCDIVWNILMIGGGILWFIETEIKTAWFNRCDIEIIEITIEGKKYIVTKQDK